MKSSKPGSEFRVILKGLKLKADVEQRIEIEIRRVVMRELAAIDYHGELAISPRTRFDRAREEGNGSTAGLVGRIVERA